MQGFAIEVSHLDGSAVVRFVGELDVAGVAELKEKLRPLLARYDADQLVFDFEALTFLDAAGLGGILHTLRNREVDRRPTLRGARPEIMRVLTTTGCEQVFDLAGAEPAGA